MTQISLFTYISLKIYKIHNVFKNKRVKNLKNRTLFTIKQISNVPKR